MTTIDISKMMFGNLELSFLFKNSYQNLLQIRKEIKNELKTLCYFDDFKIQNDGINFAKTFKKNFFTILMLSLLEKSDIEKEKIIEYGKAIFCLRTIITCTDNILDNENKGIIFIENIQNSVLSNTLLLLSAQNLLNKTLANLGDCNNRIFDNILNEIYVVAKSEELRERSLYENYPSKDEIVNKMHSGIGGALLQLSLSAPLHIEENTEKIKQFNEGLYDIGMSLQALDDLCDMKEDYDSGKVNLGLSYFIHELKMSEKNLEEIVEDNSLEKKYPNLYSEYVNNSIRKALEGFEKFEAINYPVNRKEAISLMKILFELRGIGHLWEISDFTSKKLTTHIANKHSMA